MTESVMRARFKKLLQSRALVQDVEQLGVPDMFYQHLHGSGWIELKVVRATEEMVIIPFRPGQLRWIHELLQHGGTVLVACYLPLAEDGLLTMIWGPRVQQQYSRMEFVLDKTFSSVMWSELSTEWLLRVIGAERRRPC